MRRKYNNPPLAEALCEFQFIPSQPSDMTIPGIFYEKISANFPIKQPQFGLGVNFQAQEGGLAQKVEMSQRMQFFRSDKVALMQLGTDLLTVNHLKPYPGWEDFKPMISEGIQIYRDVAKPKSLKQIGLRYINKIEIPEIPAEVTDYFEFYPFIPKSLPQDHESFQSVVEFPYEKGRDKLVVILASIFPEKQNTVLILMELQYVMVMPERISLDDVPDWIEQAHEVISNAFEACITDKSRKIFGGEEQ